MHEIWTGLFQLLLEGVASAFSVAVGGGDAFSPTELDALGTELRRLDTLLAEHGLKLDVLEPAAEFLRSALGATTAAELVMHHIREPLSRLIAEDFFVQGDTVVVDFIDGTFTIGRTV